MCGSLIVRFAKALGQTMIGNMANSKKPYFPAPLFMKISWIGPWVSRID
jgi:hypothetical protein